MDNDEIFYPFRESFYKSGKAGSLFKLSFPVTMLILCLAWPLYLLFGFGGRPSNTLSSHFAPWYASYFTTERERQQGRESLIWWLVWFGVLVYLAKFQFGWMWMAVYYAVPYFVFATWLVVVTFLHHNEPGATWYSKDEWTYVRGNLTTVDRTYGWFESIHHDIGKYFLLFVIVSFCLF
jgi:omega-3 fatty acid desaturase (delta-15 desaturase)